MGIFDGNIFDPVIFDTGVTSSTAIVIQDANLNSSIENIVLTQHEVLTISASSLASSFDNVVLSPHYSLTIQGASSLSSIDNITIVQHEVLTVSGTTSSSGIDNIVLTQHSVISINNASSESSIDNVDLVVHAAGVTVLTVQDSTLVSSIDELTVIYTAPTSNIRGHIKRHRGRHRRIYYDDIEKIEQEKIEEIAAKIANDEIELQKDKTALHEKVKVETLKEELILLQVEISDISNELKELEKQKKLILDRIEMFRDEEDIEMLLLM
jgi:hypothetical protein